PSAPVRAFLTSSLSLVDLPKHCGGNPTDMEAAWSTQARRPSAPLLLHHCPSAASRKRNIKCSLHAVQPIKSTERTQTRPQQHQVAVQERPPFVPAGNNRASVPLFSAAKSRSHPTAGPFHHTTLPDSIGRFLLLVLSGCTSTLATQFNQAEVRPATAQSRFDRGGAASFLLSIVNTWSRLSNKRKETRQHNGRLLRGSPPTS
ncbi:unnamed protein product, partial [Ectocarpus fasciculatus]